MLLPLPQIPRDTTVVTMARDPLATVSDWATVGLGVAFLALLIVLVLILLELRGLSRSWQQVLTRVADRSGPLIDSANGAVRNVEYITQVVRTDVERINGAVSGLANSLEEASEDVQGRVRDVRALLDLAQVEAEEAVLDAATRIRTLRSGQGVLSGAALRALRRRSEEPSGEEGEADG
ncbi:MAG: hypothetical protein HKO53_13790 [Gemmatimonadetes bacterium]|nr:hypothetical protein [Gemmatimonadota bacterium]NNM34141.1 hypothetical protein [Gemmatimonadota bacterium]